MNFYMFNHSGCMNRGCEAIVRGTFNIIENACKDSKYYLSSYAPEEDKVLSDIVMVKPFKPKPLSKAEYIKAALSIRLKHDERYSVIKSYSDFFSQASSADICLSVGGDTYCYGDNSVIRILTDELKKRGKKIVLWGASIGEEDLTKEKIYNLAHIDAIFARESITYNLLKEKNINPNIYLFPDPAMTLKSEKIELPEAWQGKNTLGINISPIVAAKNPMTAKIISDFIKHVLNETDMRVVLIPHVTSPLNNDFPLLQSLYDENVDGTHGKLHILPADLTASQYKGYISKLRFFIGARTHASIAAYTSFIPTIVLGYSVKSRGIALDVFGDERFVIDTCNLRDSGNIIDVFEELRKREDEVKSVLKRVIPDKINNAYNAGLILTKIANGAH